jgi:hypothetical protein
VEETREPGENHRPVTSHWQTLSHNFVHLAHCHNITEILLKVALNTIIRKKKLCEEPAHFCRTCLCEALGSLLSCLHFSLMFLYFSSMVNPVCLLIYYYFFLRIIVFNATFNNISVILWQFYWWRKPECPEKTTDLCVASHWQTLSHNVVHLALIGIQTHISSRRPE